MMETKFVIYDNISGQFLCSWKNGEDSWYWDAPYWYVEEGARFNSKSEADLVKSDLEKIFLNNGEEIDFEIFERIFDNRYLKIIKILEGRVEFNHPSLIAIKILEALDQE
jgi:hypothetical protein